jgi:hypothetical protein
MADVPHELVAWRPECGMKRDRQLDDAEPGADVSARVGAHVDEAGAHLVGERTQLVAGEASQVGWGLDAFVQSQGFEI